MTKKLYTLDTCKIDIYLQKSLKFLYPLVSSGLPGKALLPQQTFMAWRGQYKTADNMLICVFVLSIDSAYLQFERSLIGNNLFVCYKDLEEGKRAFVFNLNTYAVDLSHFKNGRYSLLSQEVKDKILLFYNANKYSTEYMDSYLNPENYFGKYAELLNVDEGLLRKGGELCAPFNLLKETCCLQVAVIPKNIGEQLHLL